MAGVQNFRSALGGFNREDVVRYIEYINNKHNSEVEQLNSQLQTAREALAQANAEDTTVLKEQLEAAQARCAELEAQLAQAAQAEPVPCEAEPARVAKTAEDELEAYRRAERAERLARDRAAMIYTQANAALADATVKVEVVSDELSELAEQLSAQAKDAKVKLQEAVAAMYAIRPEED